MNWMQSLPVYLEEHPWLEEKVVSVELYLVQW